MFDDILTDGRGPKMYCFPGKPVQYQKLMSTVSMGGLFQNGLAIIHGNEPYNDIALSYLVATIGVTIYINPSINMKTCSNSRLPLFYVRSYISELEICKSIFSINIL